jgi:hypothetical protein
LASACLLVLQRSLARVLHRQPGGDDQQLGQHAVAVGLDDHAREARVQGQLGQGAADRGEPVRRARARFGRLEGVQLQQQVDAVTHGARVRRVDERERGDVAEVQRGHRQDHRREVGAQDLRLRELGRLS